MVIVYTVGTGSKHDDVELRWSLRSIAANGRGVERVIVVGHIPKFVNPETVDCLEMEDPTRAKHYNIFAKVRAAVEKFGLTKEFLVSSDDHIYTGVTDFDEYPRFSQGDLKSKKDYGDKKLNGWWTSLVETRDLLDRCGLPHFHTRGHFNTHFDPKYMDAVATMMESTPSPDVGFEHALVMNNLKLYHEPQYRCKLVKMSDCKLDNLKNVDELTAKISQRPVISIGDGVFECKGFVEKMEKLFPDMCKYEREVPKESVATEEPVGTVVDSSASSGPEVPGTGSVVSKVVIH